MFAEATHKFALERIVIVPPTGIAMRGANANKIDVGVIPSRASSRATLANPMMVDVGVVVGAYVGATVGEALGKGVVGDPVGACVAVLERIGVLLVVSVAGANAASVLVFT
jgi:hypothetical protein